MPDDELGDFDAEIVGVKSEGSNVCIEWKSLRAWSSFQRRARPVRPLIEGKRGLRLEEVTKATKFVGPSSVNPRANETHRK